MPHTKEITSYSGTHLGAILALQERNQAWLARKMQVHEATVSRVLRGQTVITRDFVDRACRALALPESALFFTSADMHARTNKITESELIHA